MIVKLIDVRVKAKHRSRFAQGQRAWDVLKGESGFRGQIGGWDTRDTDRARIVGLWSDLVHYNRFMKEVHDPIFESNAQKGTFESTEVSIWDTVFEMPGIFDSVQPAIQQAQLIRIARCEVRSDRVEHFTCVQREIWMPGMAATGGMTAGLFCTGQGDPHRFLVCSFWETQADHQRYLDGPFPALRRRARVERDCERVTGSLTRVEPGWIVSPAPRERSRLES